MGGMKMKNAESREAVGAEALAVGFSLPYPVLPAAVSESGVARFLVLLSGCGMNLYRGSSFRGPASWIFAVTSLASSGYSVRMQSLHSPWLKSASVCSSTYCSTCCQ